MTDFVRETPPGFVRKLMGSRVVYAPKISVRATHARFLEQAKAGELIFRDPLFGVKRHLEHEHRFFFKTDLRSAFDHVTFAQMRAVLLARGIKLGWLTPRQHFFHERGRGGLIQGAPASPFLFETYCRYSGLDRDLYEYCDKLGFCYTRYADDLLISSRRHLGKRVGPSVRRIVGNYGFELSDKKTKRVDAHAEPLMVLGYVIQGTRIDASLDTLQALYDHDLSDEARTGTHGWRRRVREVGRKRRSVIRR